MVRKIQIENEDLLGLNSPEKTYETVNFEKMMNNDSNLEYENQFLPNNQEEFGYANNFNNKNYQQNENLCNDDLRREYYQSIDEELIKNINENYDENKKDQEFDQNESYKQDIQKFRNITEKSL